MPLFGPCLAPPVAIKNETHLGEIMRRLSIFFLVVLTATMAFACGSASSPTATPESAAPASAAPASAADGDVCPVTDPGPPPACPEGCVWNGTECRKNSSIIMPNARDGGTPGPG
jgi:hypothetical protein